MEKSPDAFRTISETADWLGVPAHVLRFWESRFPQVKPVKRAGGRRYYRPGDMQLLGGIRKLLHDDGMTIKGVQTILKDKGVAHVSALSPDLSSPAQPVRIEPTPKDDMPPVMIDDDIPAPAPTAEDERPIETQGAGADQTPSDQSELPLAPPPDLELIPDWRTITDPQIEDDIAVQTGVLHRAAQLHTLPLDQIRAARRTTRAIRHWTKASDAREQSAKIG